MICERCRLASMGYTLFDYCAECGKNLCGGCMEQGCCGRVPAASGHEADNKEEGGHE